MADYDDVDPTYGTLADFDRLLARRARARLKLLMDLVPCHTSIEHPWFREHPERYVWSDGDGPPNNWVAAFGGPAWSSDPTDAAAGTCTRSTPSSPTWTGATRRSVAAMQDVMRFWLDRGVDGFRHRRDRPAAEGRRAARRPAGDRRRSPLPLGEEYARPRAPPLGQRAGHRRSRLAAHARGSRRRAAGRRGVPAGRRRSRPTSSTSTPRSSSSSSTRRWERRGGVAAGRPSSAPGADSRLGALEPRLPARRRRASGRSTCASPRCCCSRCPASRSSTRATRSARPTAPAPTRRSTAPEPSEIGLADIRAFMAQDRAGWEPLVKTSGVQLQ